MLPKRPPIHLTVFFSSSCHHWPPRRRAMPRSRARQKCRSSLPSGIGALVHSEFEDDEPMALMTPAAGAIEDDTPPLSPADVLSAYDYLPTRRFRWPFRSLLAMDHSHPDASGARQR